MYMKQWEEKWGGENLFDNAYFGINTHFWSTKWKINWQVIIFKTILQDLKAVRMENVYEKFRTQKRKREKREKKRQGKNGEEDLKKRK